MNNILTFFEYLNEIDFNIISTEYAISKMDDIIRYTFLSNKKNSYSVYFRTTSEDNEKLSDSSNLSDYTDLNNIPTIFFSLTERNFDDNFNELTNKQEFLEIIGKVVFIILEIIRKNNYTVYSIGTVGSKNIQLYNHYRKYFNQFKIETGLSKNYIDDSNNKQYVYYLIKNKNTKKYEKVKIDNNAYLKLN